MPTFDTPEPIRLTLDVPQGSVRVVASERTDTRVTVSGAEGAEGPRVEFTGGRVVIGGPPPRRLGRALDWLRGGESLDIVVELPAGSCVDARVTSGDHRGEGRLGECRMVTDYGDIRVEEAGPVHLTTRYGEIQLDRATGRAELSTAAGDVRAGDLDGPAEIGNSYGEVRVGTVTGELVVKGLYGEVRVGRAHAGVTARTAYGAIRVQEVVRGTVDLSSHSGELQVGVRSGTAAWLDAHSTTGHVRNSLDVRDGADGFVDTVEIRARTHDGDIVVDRA